MKAKVKSTGEVIDVEPNIYKHEIVSWSNKKENGDKIYLPEDIEVDVTEIEQELTKVRKMALEEAQSKIEWLTCSDGFNEINISEVKWKEVEIRAALHALSACIIAGKKDAAKSAVYYAKHLVDELKK